MQDERFEWDDDKAAQNAAKHRVTFELARCAFDDPNFLEREDPDPDEDRFTRSCMFEGRVFVLTYVERYQRIRIISARLANKHEQRTYFR